MGILESLVVVATCVLFLILIAAYRHGRDLSAFLVGAAAGLVAIQVFRVHLFTILVLVWVCQRGGAFKSKGFFRALMVAIPVGLLALTTFVGDLVNSDTLFLQLIGLAVTSALVMAFATGEDRRQMINGLLGVTTVSSIVGLLQVVKIVPIETWHATISSVGRPIGIYPEPDWLGMFAGIGLVLAWRLPLGKWTKIIAVSVNAAAFVLAFARAAWIAVAVAVIVTFVASRIISRVRGEKRTRSGRGVAVAILAIGAFGVLLFMPQFVEDLTTRLSRTLQVEGDDISGQARVRQINSLLHLADIAPFYGHGLSASGRVGVWGDIITGVDSQNNVASNWLLAMWVDGKWLALPLILLLVFTAARYCLSIPGQALGIVLLSSLFSNATFFPVTWLLLALCLAEVKAANEAEEHEAPVPTLSAEEGLIVLKQQRL